MSISVITGAGWDNAMTVLKEASEEDLKLLEQIESGKMPGDDKKPDKKKGKGKKDASEGSAPSATSIRRGPISTDGVQMVYVKEPEPKFNPVKGSDTSTRILKCNAVADRA
ncbi:unnamed protein product, partial [Chrysoparadoxa australica]